MTPDFVFQVFTKNSLMKNIFVQEEKKFDSIAQFFFKNSFLLGVFWPSRGLQINHRTVKKLQYSCNQVVKNGLKEGILLISIIEALL